MPVLQTERHRPRPRDTERDHRKGDDRGLKHTHTDGPRDTERDHRKGDDRRLKHTHRQIERQREITETEMLGD